MKIAKYEKKYAAQIADLLNNYLPFLPESEETVDGAGGIRMVYINEESQVIGYIAGYEITDFQEDFPFFEKEVYKIKKIAKEKKTYYTSHFVVHPEYRRKGIGSKLVEAYEKEVFNEADVIVVVGWVQSDTNCWAAEKSFVKFEFLPFVYIPRYFEPYDVECPSCKGKCFCDAHIFIKKSTD